MPIGVYYRPVRPVIVPIGPSIAYVQLTKGKFSLVDAGDATWIGKYNWTADRGTGHQKESFYALRRSTGDKIHKKLRLHTEVLKPPPGKLTDHINGDTLDNRRANLREATNSQNAINGALRKDNTTGYKGISHLPTQRGGKFWNARININHKPVHLGCFLTKEDAIAARKTAEVYYGEFLRRG